MDNMDRFVGTLNRDCVLLQYAGERRPDCEAVEWLIDLVGWQGVSDVGGSSM